LEELLESRDILSAEARRAKEEAYKKEVQSFEAFVAESERDLQEQRKDMTQRVGQQIGAIIRRYAEEEGYDLVFDKRGLLFLSEKFDVTDDLIADMEARGEEESSPEATGGAEGEAAEEPTGEEVELEVQDSE
jgi:Skp family chaperone for outer membrane proteins